MPHFFAAIGVYVENNAYICTKYSKKKKVKVKR